MQNQGCVLTVLTAVPGFMLKLWQKGLGVGAHAEHHADHTMIEPKTGVGIQHYDDQPAGQGRAVCSTELLRG